MMNLFANSLKFTTDGLITVRLELKEDAEHEGRVTAALTVKDTGRGISNEYLHNYLCKSPLSSSRLDWSVLRLV